MMFMTRKHNYPIGRNCAIRVGAVALLLSIANILLRRLPSPRLQRQRVAAVAGGQIIVNDCLSQLSHVRNIKLYSQNDEDGALLQTLRCMGGHGTKEYFEFGSEDGTEVNTRILRELYGWHGHLLDGGYDKPDINLHKELFTPSNIVSLLGKYNAGKSLDVLSIDADYDDFWIMREILLAEYTPRVLVTEYNVNLGHEWSITTIAKPVGRESSTSWTYDCYFGASATALIGLARVFGYTPVWANDVNLIFVRRDEAIDRGMLIPSIESFPGPYTRSLHHDCSGRTWKLIDDDGNNNNLAKATDKNIPHVDFSEAFADVRLASKNYGNPGRSDLEWRVFHREPK